MGIIDQQNVSINLSVADIQSALVNPGPDLVICDEGHRIKNSHASISQALKQIRTKRRVVLTGITHAGSHACAVVFNLSPQKKIEN